MRCKCFYYTLKLESLSLLVDAFSLLLRVESCLGSASGNEKAFPRFNCIYFQMVIGQVLVYHRQHICLVLVGQRQVRNKALFDLRQDSTL